MEIAKFSPEKEELKFIKPPELPEFVEYEVRQNPTLKEIMATEENLMWQ